MIGIAPLSFRLFRWFSVEEFAKNSDREAHADGRFCIFRYISQATEKLDFFAALHCTSLI